MSVFPSNKKDQCNRKQGKPNVSRVFSFKIVSVNTRGVANEEKRRAVFNFHRFNADVLILQETHSTREQEQIWESEWGGKAIFSHGTSAARGIAVFMSKERFERTKNIILSEDGRTIIFDIEENGQTITIAAIYAPNLDSPQYFVHLGKIMQERSEHKIIIGDFNLTLNTELDRENTYCNNNNATEEVKVLMEQYCLEDVWRLQNEDKREFSWIKSGSYPIKASRLDFALVSKGLDQKVQMSQYTSSIKTDHRAFYMVVDTDPFERGTGYWKFNNTLLQKPQFLQKMNTELETTIELSKHQNPSQAWETIKKRIKTVAKEFSRTSASEDKLIISQLAEKVCEYESRLPLNREDTKILEDTKAELDEKSIERIKGVMFRSKAQWYEEGERNTKYFYALEKAKYNAKTCYKIITAQGQEITDPQLILEEQRNFYTELYSKDKNVNFSMENTEKLYVPEEIKIQQEEQLTMSDLEIAIKRMKNNKTPGEDGISVDFYKVFWKILKVPFHNMVLHNYQQGSLHQTARQGILNLIPKANKDTRIIKNLRPITLLNTDYKIIEKAVADKMIPALKHIIGSDQRGFMKDRRISVNIRKMLDIMHEAEKEDLEAIVLSLDFVKCFDKCSFSILHGSLDFFQFGDIVKNWTRVLYHDFTV